MWQGKRSVILRAFASNIATTEHAASWMGPSLKDSYIVALEADTVTIKVIQCTWNRRTHKYEEGVAADFAALGLAALGK